MLCAAGSIIVHTHPMQVSNIDIMYRGSQLNSVARCLGSPVSCLELERKTALGCVHNSGDAFGTLRHSCCIIDQCSLAGAEAGRYSTPFSSKPFHVRLKGPMPANAVSSNSTCSQHIQLGTWLTIYYIAVTMLSDGTVRHSTS
jgi:hypothetical protein